ncbi:hypothetical protein [Microcoleus sp. B4-D4]|uniref:hypothetical protein n=1 Tax=Microcoleus sp. B4-D4 TaxID=2818667 RepID=UPI002FD444EB
MPKVECYPGALNQVFMTILGNAIDSWENRPAPKTIAISTALVAREWEDAEFGKSILFVGAAPVGAGSANGKFVVIRIRDSGPRLTQKAKSRLFGPFFITNPDGAGYGTRLVYQLPDCGGTTGLQFEVYLGTLTGRRFLDLNPALSPRAGQTKNWRAIGFKNIFEILLSKCLTDLGV